MLQNIIQVHEISSWTENSLRHGRIVLSKVSKDMDFNSPLYYYSLPGLFLGASGVYMGLNILQSFEPGENFGLEYAAFVFMQTLVGICMFFTGILLHLIDSMIKYTRNKLDRMRIT